VDSDEAKEGFVCARLRFANLLKEGRRLCSPSVRGKATVSADLVGSKLGCCLGGGPGGGWEDDASEPEGGRDGDGD
jgi:hypothetical protein